jgi:DNA-binding SARP family transcriptional activator/TolB-like protein
VTGRNFALPVTPPLSAFIRLRLLGAVDVRDQHGSMLETVCAQPKRVALLAYLAVAPGRDPVRRDTLLHLFWPESNQTQARRALNQAIHFLRTELGNDLLLSRGAESLALAESGLWCDATAFDDAIRRGAHDEALQLYTGGFLEGFSLPGLSEFDTWADGERRKRAALAADAAWACADEAWRAGDSARAVSLGRRAAALAANEAGLRRLLVLLDKAGDRVGALRAYDEFARRLKSEFDAEPSPETNAVIAAVRGRATPSSEPVPAVPSAPAPAATAAPVAAPRVSVADPRAEAPEPRRFPAFRRRTVIAGALVMALAIVAAMKLGGGTAMDPAAARTIAVFPFTYRGGQDLGHLGESISTLMASNVSSGGLSTVDARALAAAAEREGADALTVDQAVKLARGFGAGLFVMGDVTESGGRLRIDAMLYDRTGVSDEVQARAEGSSANLFELVDQVTRELMKSRADAGSGDLYRSAALTTHSIDALRAYAIGEQAMRAGRYTAAVDEFRRAVKMDSTFALAYYGLSTAANWTGDGGLAGYGAAGALANRSRVSPRDRARFEAWDAYLHGDYHRTEKLYTAVIAENPSDVDAVYHRADLYFHWGASYGRPLVELKPDWERVLQLDPRNAGVLLHAARVAAATRDKPWFDSLAARLSELGADAARNAELHGLAAFAFGDRAARVAAAAEIGLLPEPVRRSIFATVAATSRDLVDVPELLAPLLFLGHNFMSFEDGQVLVVAQIALARGHVAAARARIDTVTLLRPRRAREFRALFATLQVPAADASERRAALAALDRPLTADELPRAGEPLRLYLQALLSARLGDSVSALRHAATLERYSSPLETNAADFAKFFARIVRAELLLGGGKAREALAALGEPQGSPDNRLPYVWSYPVAHARFLRAEVLAALGRNDEALRWYATFPDPNIHDVMFLPSALLRRAQLLERMSRTAEAAEGYGRLASLWATADAPLQPFVQELRGRAGGKTAR